MKKKNLILFVFVLALLLFLIISAIIIIRTTSKSVNQIYGDELAEDEHIEHNENEVNIDNTISEIAEGNESNNEANENVEPENKDDTKEPITTEIKTNTQVETKEKNIQNNKISETIKKPQSTIQAEQKSTQAETKTEQTKTTETVKPEEKLKCTKDKHYADVGNSNKWFNTEAEAIAYYKSIIKEWGSKYEKFEIDDATYNKNCPARI